MVGFDPGQGRPRDGSFRAPEPATGLALRPVVLDLLSRPRARCGVVTAPSGYGKTTHVAAWVAADDRPTAWLDLDRRHDDPGLFLTDVVAALQSVTDLTVPEISVGGATADADTYATAVAPALGRAVQRCTTPFVLVIDDVHRVEDESVVDLLEAVLTGVPAGSAVVLVGRTCRLEKLARLRTSGTVVEIGIEALALDAPDVALVLAGMGVEADADQVARVTADTEGWPVGVRLAGLAALADVEHRVPGVSGREANVFDYLHSQWLWGLADDDREFLVRVSILEWLSPALCNDVLARTDAGEVLHRISTNRLLLIPLDRRGDAYRMHGLLQEALRAELERSDAAAAHELNERASSWFEKAGDIDRAVQHALAGDAPARAEQLVLEHWPAYYTNGRYPTLDRWLDALPHDQVVSNPSLCLCAALAALAGGRADGLKVWLRLGEHAASAAPEADPIANLCLRDLRSTTNVGPVGPALDDAAAAYQGLPPGIWHAASCLAYGVWLWTVGDPAAVAILTGGAEEASVHGAPAMEANCTALLAAIAFAEHDATRGSTLATRAKAIASQHLLERAPGQAILSAVAALAAATRGEAETARAESNLARGQLAQLKDLSGWANVQTRIALGHTAVLLGDRIGAETMVGELHEFLVQQPDASRARRQLEELETLVGHMHRAATIGASSLTTAELRVLHYLPTNLSLADIGRRLFVSRYTVKTHCQSIYRKLQVSSRSGAVDVAREIGLLPTETTEPQG